MVEVAEFEVGFFMKLLYLYMNIITTLPPAGARERKTKTVINV